MCSESGKKGSGHGPQIESARSRLNGAAASSMSLITANVSDSDVSRALPRASAHGLDRHFLHCDSAEVINQSARTKHADSK